MGSVVLAPVGDVIDGSGGLDEVDFIVEGDVDGVLVGEPVSVGDVVEIGLDSDVEAILACPAVGHRGGGTDVSTVGLPFAGLGSGGGGDEGKNLHFFNEFKSFFGFELSS